MTNTTQPDPAPSDETRAFLERRSFGHYVNGRWDTSGRERAVINPCLEAEIARVPDGGIREVDAAVKAARNAFENVLPGVLARQREAWLLAIADAIESNRALFRELIVLENGKALFEADGEVSVSVDSFRYYAGWPTKIHGETLPPTGDMECFVRREPVGVCGLIVPWNGPLASPTWKIATALACGNSAVLKPAEDTPLSAVLLVELIEKVGVPAGVINLVLGDGTVGAALASHPGIDKVSFTGSTAVGKSIVQASAGNLKRLSLELGGKSASIVFPDADLESAAATLAHAVFRNTGQMCTAASRIFVHRKVLEEFTARLVARAKAERLGNGLNPETTMGPLVSKKQHTRVSRYIDLAREAGLSCAHGGGSGGMKRGYFVEPTILEGASNAMQIAQEEIFGPVTAIMPFSDDDDVIALANDTVYGLAASVWTRDLSRAHRTVNRLKAGTVWLNTYNMLDPSRPLGGFKQSGFGRELGIQSIDAFTELKTVVIQH